MSRAGGEPGEPLIGLLGPVTMWRDGQAHSVPGRLDRAVLMHLVLAERRAVSVDALTDALWPHDPPARARNALQVKVSRLRRLLGPDAGLLRYEQGAYRLDIPAHRIDAGRFAAALAAGEELLRDGEHAAAAARLGAVLATWRGRPLADLDDQPRVVSARARFAELRATALEAYAEARLDDPVARPVAIDDLRALLDRDPLRPRARLALMRGLDAAGRRPEALAVYDAARKLFAARTGLEPPDLLREAFEDLLAAERRSTRQAKIAAHLPRAGPAGLLETVRWVADDGDVDAALQLAVRGAWWWWLGGPRARAAELFEDLLSRSVAEGRDGLGDGVAVLGAQAWTGVFGAMDEQARGALRVAEAALHQQRRPAWTDRDALAATLIAERLWARGEPERARRLLDLAVRHYAHSEDEWGQAMCAAVSARGRLGAGEVPGAQREAAAQLQVFTELGDSAGQLMSLDILGYCAEIRGDLAAAGRIHARALDLARRAQSPDWELAQVTRLGNVAALAGRPDAAGRLAEAATLSSDIGSNAVAALARNGRGVALGIAGDRDAALAEHQAVFAWYQRTGAAAGLAYTTARIASLLAEDDGDGGYALAIESLAFACRTRDPRAVALSLEAVALTADNPAEAAQCLGAASALRAAAPAPLPPTQLGPLLRRREALAMRLGPRMRVVAQRGARSPDRLAATLVAQTGAGDLPPQHHEAPRPA